jgi:hypothetical protein
MVGALSKSIAKFQTIFIHSCNQGTENKSFSKSPKFKDLMDFVLDDEFADDFAELIDRNTLFTGEGQFRETVVGVEIYESMFHYFGCAIIYTRIFSEKPITFEDFALLCSGNKYLDHIKGDFGTIRQCLKSAGVHYQLKQNAFLIAQIQETRPAYSKSENIEGTVIGHFDGLIEQLLLRSDTNRHDLRPDNHSHSHLNLSNFYGAIDFCSQNTLVQIYQRPVRNLFDQTHEISANYRMCWWLALTDILHLQKFVLKQSERRVDILDFNSGKRVVSQIDEIDNIIRDLKKYWSLASMTHPMSKVVTEKIRARIGLDERLRRVQEKLSNSEKIITRSIEESRSRQVGVLNYLIILLAAIELFPFIQKAIYSILNKFGYELETPALFTMTTGFGVLLPIIIFAYIGTLRRHYKSRVTSD